MVIFFEVWKKSIGECLCLLIDRTGFESRHGASSQAGFGGGADNS